jgi:DNA polymerase-3 subunit delta'
MLLHGPSGVGKWDLAVCFAADLLCESPGADQTACGRCASCQLLAAGNHPDLRVLVPDLLAERRPISAGEAEDVGGAGVEPAASKTKPSREIKIGQVHELAALFELTAHRGGARVAVLGPAEALNLPAASALLKGLEEPPANCYFVLVSDQLDRCLPTVVSRCSLVRVALPPAAHALPWLQAQGMSAEEAATRLAEAGGAPMAAVRSSGEALEPQMRATLLALLRRGANLSAAEVVNDVPRTIPIGASVVLFQRWVWDYFSFRTGGALRYHPLEAKAFEALAPVWSLQAASAWADRLRSLRAVAEHPLNPRAAVEGILLEYIGSIAEVAQ